jgi:hypothetical protein
VGRVTFCGKARHEEPHGSRADGVGFCGGVCLRAAGDSGGRVYGIEVQPAEGEHLLQGVLEIAGEAAVCVALLSALGWWLARRALRPLETLT